MIYSDCLYFTLQITSSPWFGGFSYFLTPTDLPAHQAGDTGNCQLPFPQHKHEETLADRLRTFDTDSIKQRFNPSVLGRVVGHCVSVYMGVFSCQVYGGDKAAFPRPYAEPSQILSNSCLIQSLTSNLTFVGVIHGLMVLYAVIQEGSEVVTSRHGWPL